MVSTIPPPPAFEPWLVAHGERILREYFPEPWSTSDLRSAVYIAAVEYQWLYGIPGAPTPRGFLS